MSHQFVNETAINLLKDLIDADVTEQKEDRGGYWRDTQRAKQALVQFIKTKHPDLSDNEIAGRADWMMYLFMNRQA